MIEAAMIWNEPNNRSHWDLGLDPDFMLFAEMARLAGAAIRAEAPGLTRVLGGMSPIDPGFLENMRARGVLDHVDAVAVHGFPLDWCLWQIDDWPEKIASIRAIAGMPVWVSETGVSSFGADAVQAWGLERSAQLLAGSAPRVQWYSLFDLPLAWGAATHHSEEDGASYYRHFHMGLIRADGTLKPALEVFARHADTFGLVQWFHFEDPRLDDAVAWMKRLGVRHLRTGLSWADSFRPGADAFFDRLMGALEPFDLTVTFCFTPEHRGLAPHHSSPPAVPEEYAEFCARMIRRYVGSSRAVAPALDSLAV